MSDADMSEVGYDTDYGFVYGPMEVVRSATVVGKGGKVKSYLLSVDTDRVKLDIWVSPGGRSVRVVKDGVELS